MVPPCASRTTFGTAVVPLPARIGRSPSVTVGFWSIVTVDSSSPDGVPVARLLFAKSLMFAPEAIVTLSVPLSGSAFDAVKR